MSTWNGLNRPNSYFYGAKARFSAAFTDTDDAATDPDVVKFTIETPAGNETTHTYWGGTLLKASTGNYYIDIELSTVGTWHGRWWSTGAGQAAVEGDIIVKASEFD